MITNRLLKLKLPKIYPITDKKMSGLSHREQVSMMAAAGAEFIQIRDKVSGSGEFLADAIESVQEAHRFGSLLIVNDRVDIALAAGADGVHLGQDDLPPADARKLLGEKGIIGYSTHSVKQAIAALKEPVDYIAIGPIFETGTKNDTSPVVGLDGIKAVRNAVGNFPLVAIGGIGLDNVSDVLRAGADSAAIISAVAAESAGVSFAVNALLDAVNG